MSSGSVHAKVTAILSPIVGLGVALATKDFLCASVASGGCLLGLFVQSDMDTIGLGESGSYPLYVMRWTFGNPASWLYRLYWTPYSRFMAHRSFFSHFPVVGTLLRILYLAPITVLVWKHELFWYGVFGLAVSDFGHWIFDFRYFGKRQ